MGSLGISSSIRYRVSGTRVSGLMSGTMGNRALALGSLLIRASWEGGKHFQMGMGPKHGHGVVTGGPLEGLPGAWGGGATESSAYQ